MPSRGPLSRHRTGKGRDRDREETWEELIPEWRLWTECYRGVPGRLDHMGKVQGQESMTHWRIAGDGGGLEGGL